MLNSVAQELRQAREARGWSIVQASQAARVAEKFLLELEEGGNEAPVDIYRREFLRHYARALELDAQVLWKRFEQERQWFTHQQTIQFEQYSPSWLHQPRAWRRVFGAVALSSMMLYVLFSFTRVWAAPDLLVQYPQERDTVSTREISVRGMVSSDATVLINGTSIVPTPMGTFELPIVLSPGLNTITVEAQRKHLRSTTVTRHVFVNQ